MEAKQLSSSAMTLLSSWKRFLVPKVTRPAYVLIIYLLLFSSDILLLMERRQQSRNGTLNHISHIHDAI